MTKTAEQVVAEALAYGEYGNGTDPSDWEISAQEILDALRDAGMLRDNQPVIDREAVAREVYRELYPGTIGTHDSKRTPESDLAEADLAYLTWDNGNEGFAPGIVCRRVADRVIAHLDAGETEWEYGLLDPQASGGAHLVSRNREHIIAQQKRGVPTIQAVRRRKAGEWEPVEGESK